MRKADIIAQLKKGILPLQGLDQPGCKSLDDACWFFKHAFPQQSFPLGCIHEFLAFTAEEKAATRGFIHSILSQLLSQQICAAWITSSQDHFPGALSRFGTTAQQLLFIQHNKSKELLWVVEEFLKYKQLKIVIAELETLDFTASRRFQLAVERSGLTAFVIRTHAHKNNNNTAAVRWQVKPLSSMNDEGLPGIGYPSWKVDLLKMRHGRSASADLVWKFGKLLLLSQFNQLHLQPAKKLAG